MEKLSTVKLYNISNIIGEIKNFNEKELLEISESFEFFNYENRQTLNIENFDNMIHILNIKLSKTQLIEAF